MCVRDCNDPANENCGGLAHHWDTLYSSVSEYCERLSTWVARGLHRLENASMKKRVVSSKWPCVKGFQLLLGCYAYFIKRTACLLRNDLSVLHQTTPTTCLGVTFPVSSFT